VGERLGAAGHEVGEREADALEPHRYVVSDPDGNEIEIHGRIDRSGEFAGGGGRRPERIQHVAFSTPNIPELLAFYEEVLGFRLSDRMGGDSFLWLRSDHYHHSLALIKREGRCMDHFSFDLADWEDVKLWCDKFARNDVSVVWGPGRHGPGNNLFIMFRDPQGTLLEYSLEMELYWDDVTEQEPRYWENTGKSVSLWGAWPDFRQEG
jgi:catechol 2,3-dioxygenase